MGIIVWLKDLKDNTSKITALCLQVCVVANISAYADLRDKY